MKSTLTKAHAHHIANLVWVENKPARASAMLREHVPEMGIVEAQRCLNGGSWGSLYAKLVRDFVEPDDVKFARLRNERQALDEQIFMLEQEMGITKPMTQPSFTGYATQEGLKVGDGRESLPSVEVLPLEGIESNKVVVILRIPYDLECLWPGLRGIPARLRAVQEYMIETPEFKAGAGWELKFEIDRNKLVNGDFNG